ncbi:NAD(P)-dependent dehydrogenase (short-subunit alcohol dehydrogenase family) [Streptomyces sp. B1I3]|nr:NAD(P)-dependent dehydrogenase (short-subunit alcohol dehydrogenase family) [Streptomyces sp. B1I3]
MTITLITGANKGLGFETARRLVEAGHTVYVGARDARRGQEAAARLGARFVPIDITDEKSVEAAAASVREEAGRLDVLVNNAGIVGVRKPVGEVTRGRHAGHVRHERLRGRPGHPRLPAAAGGR